ncbi:Hydroxyacid oxidase [Geosmithia morbida]|uniref:Hydroxyacid oxidase n=1 Tax=Geosmithia morbida TaxID=1094350 RepID=A0A9P4YWJ7_9HYPO|nr:Hydroxyacid oxidase [Geosmithia morbida]KAF4123355.1 Hydroxyacid oxidase [Geosmithia morbida]
MGPMGSYIDWGMIWRDIEWIGSDVKVAIEGGVEGIMLSNHGSATSASLRLSILLLLEMHRNRS